MQALLTLIVVWLSINFGLPPIYDHPKVEFVSAARAHDWYPVDCCGGQDCAPVESMIRLVPTGRGNARWLVTSRHGMAVVPDDFSARTSQDGRMHVCMLPDAFGDMEVKCLFLPPQI